MDARNLAVFILDSPVSPGNPLCRSPDSNLNHVYFSFSEGRLEITSNRRQSLNFNSVLDRGDGPPLFEVFVEAEHDGPEVDAHA